MNKILALLTLVLVGTAVGAVAVYLILIAAHLVRANRNLARLVGGLEAVRDNTAPLGRDLRAINSAAVTLEQHLVSVDGHLIEIKRAAQYQGGKGHVL